MAAPHCPQTFPCKETDMERGLHTAALVLLALLLVPAALSGAADPDTIFRKLVVTDRDGFGTEALRLLVPKAWSFSGGSPGTSASCPPRPSRPLPSPAPTGNRYRSSAVT